MLIQNHTTTEYTRFEKWKILAHSSKIEMIRRGSIPPPAVLVVYPTNLCMYECGHCIMKEEKEAFPSHLPASTMKKIALDAKRWEIKCVVFSGGGDPLMHPNTIDVARELKEYKIKTALNTQGIAISDVNAQIVKESFDYIRISVDAATKETYNNVHGFNGWDKIEKAISLLTTNKRGEVGLSFLITPENYREVSEFCYWAEKYDYDFIHIRPAYLPNSNIKDIIDTHRDGWKDGLSCFRNVHFRLDKFEGFWSPKTYTKCWSNALTGVIAADGSFLICQDVFARFGNYNIESFEGVWWGKQHSEAMKNIKLEDCPRCVANGYNEIIENWDKLKMEIL